MRDSSLDLPDMPAAREREPRARYQKIVGAQTVRRQGETVPLRRLRPELESPERRTRERAWRLGTGRRLKDAAAVSEVWRSLVSSRAELPSGAGALSDSALCLERLEGAPVHPDAGYRAQLAVEEFVTSVLVRLHERRRHQLSLRTIRPWDLLTLPPDFPFDPLFTSPREAIEAVNRAWRDVQDQAGAVVNAPDGPSDWLESDEGIEGFLACYGQAVVRARMPGPTDARRGVDDVARVALPLLVLHGTEDRGRNGNAPTRRQRMRIRHLERRLLSWTFGAMIDAFEEWVYSHPDQSQDEDVPGVTWSRLWLRFLPAVDWSGLEDMLKLEWQWHDSLFLRPRESMNRIARELQVFKAWSQTTEPRDWFQGLAITQVAGAHSLQSAPAINDQDLLDVARWMEDTIEDLEGNH